LKMEVAGCWYWFSGCVFTRCCYGQCLRHFGDICCLHFWLEYEGPSLLLLILLLDLYIVCMLTLSPTFRRYTLTRRSWAYRWFTVHVEYGHGFLHGVDVGNVTDVSEIQAAFTSNLKMEWLTVDIGYALGSLHRVDVGSVTDVSEMHAASTCNLKMRFRNACNIAHIHAV
jgi:hypothetical protein